MRTPGHELGVLFARKAADGVIGRGGQHKLSALGFCWLVTLAICLVQIVLYAADRSSGMGVGLVISLVWFLTICFAVGATGPIALWLFITLPLGAPLISVLLYVLAASIIGLV